MDKVANLSCRNFLLSLFASWKNPGLRRWPDSKCITENNVYQATVVETKADGEQKVETYVDVSDPLGRKDMRVIKAPLSILTRRARPS